MEYLLAYAIFRFLMQGDVKMYVIYLMLFYVLKY